MRARISERNFFPNFTPKEEYFKLHTMFCDKEAFCLRKSSGLYTYSFYDYLERDFLQWELRGTFTSLEEMMRSFQIRNIDVSDSFSEDNLLDYIQFLANAFVFIKSDSLYPFCVYRGREIETRIVHHYGLILNKLNSEIVTINEEMVVLYKDDIAAAVSTQQPDLAPSIVEYLKIDNRNDLERKGEILCSLAKQLEPYEQLLKDSGFLQLCKDATFLLNKTGIRHALDPNDPIEARFLAMEDQERIRWYDRAFKTVLACMAVLPYIDFKDEIKDIKRNG